MGCSKLKTYSELFLKNWNSNIINEQIMFKIKFVNVKEDLA